jgi:putative acetyltransferase
MTTTNRSEMAGDNDAIHALTKASFGNAPHADHNEQFIVESLRNARALAISLVAEDAGALVGHVALSPVRVSDGAQGWTGSERKAPAAAWCSAIQGSMAGLVSSPRQA